MKQLVKLWKRPSNDGCSFIYYIIYKDEYSKRKQKSLGHCNRRKAERQRAELERELRTGSFESYPMDLKEFTQDSLTRTGDQIRESTHYEYNLAMNDFIRKLGNIDFANVTLAHGEKYRQACLDNGNSPATVAKKLRHLKRLFQLAVKRRQLDENPLKYIDMPRVRKKKIRIYSDDECRKILNASHQFCLGHDHDYYPRWDLLVLTALSTAMRRAELLNLTWNDIDFEEQVINITPKIDCASTWRWDIKDADERTLPLTDEVTQLLVDHQAGQPEGYPYVFVPAARYDYIQTLRPKGQWKYTDSRLKVINHFCRKFKRIRTLAEVKNGQFHDLRLFPVSRSGTGELLELRERLIGSSPWGRT